MAEDSSISDVTSDEEEPSVTFTIDKAGTSSDQPGGPLSSSHCFTNDRHGGVSHSKTDDSSDSWSDSEDSESEEHIKLCSSEIKDDPKKSHSKKELQLSSCLQSDINPETECYLNTDIYAKPQLQNRKLTDLLLNPNKHSDIMKKSILTPDFEKKTDELQAIESVRHGKKVRREERAKSKGKSWYDFRSPDMTEELKNDLTVIHMRRSLDPKRFYKGPDIQALPKFFQMGTIVESAADFHHSRIPKKQRKQTLVEELLEDADFRTYNKRKYTEIQEAKTKGRGVYQQAKRFKRKKKTKK